jgi:hypothetical protein
VSIIECLVKDQPLLYPYLNGAMWSVAPSCQRGSSLGQLFVVINSVVMFSYSFCPWILTRDTLYEQSKSSISARHGSLASLSINNCDMSDLIKWSVLRFGRMYLSLSK